MLITKIAKILISADVIGQADADILLKQLGYNDNKFIGLLIEQQIVTAKQLAGILSKALDLPLVDLAQINPNTIVWDLLDKDFCLQHKVLPIELSGQQLKLAIANPTNELILQKIQLKTEYVLNLVVVEFDKLQDLLDRELDAKLNSQRWQNLANFLPATEVVNNFNYPVVDFLDELFKQAVALSVSDLHFEPYENNYRIRFRVDGKLREVNRPPLGMKDSLASRIKVIANLDIAEKRIPQDGKISLIISGNKVDFRVSTLPSLFGEKIVIRILERGSLQLDIGALGYNRQQQELLLQAIKRPYGMVLVTGPTGSGKTLSLYSCLNLLNTDQVNIIAVEDPVEITLPGINQVNVNEKAGLDFATALRAFLRQDPDIIMVGEIRDVETADIAVKAAQTGHLVLSTLHTNDAPSAITRLLNMGISPFNVASALILISAQRLVRRLCEYCKQVVDISPQILAQAGATNYQLAQPWQLYKAVGCTQCTDGYKGRIGIYQLMPISEKIQQIILANGSAQEIAKQANLEGVQSLRQLGLEKVQQGITSLAEVLSVTNI